MKISFSTEVVDLHHQSPNRNQRESKYYWDELYQLMAAAGFSSIEIPYEVKWDFGGRSGIPLSRRSIEVKFGTVSHYRKWLHSFGIEGISCIHFDPTLFCNGNFMMYFGAFRHFATEALEFAKLSGAEIVTLSVTPTQYAVSTLKQENETQEEFEEKFLNRLVEEIDLLAEMAEACKVKLCLKNEYWSLLRGDKLISFMQACKHRVFLDIDTANLNIAGTDVVSFVKKHKEHIGVVHITDTAFTDDQEAYKQALPEFPAQRAARVFRDIGHGNMDIKAILTSLNEIGYNGTLIFNCRHSMDVSRSLLRTRYFIKQAVKEGILEEQTCQI